MSMQCRVSNKITPLGLHSMIPKEEDMEAVEDMKVVEDTKAEEEVEEHLAEVEG